MSNCTLADWAAMAPCMANQTASKVEGWQGAKTGFPQGETLRPSPLTSKWQSCGDDGDEQSWICLLITSDVHQNKNLP